MAVFWKELQEVRIHKKNKTSTCCSTESSSNCKSVRLRTSEKVDWAVKRHECENIMVWIIISVDFENTAKDGIVEMSWHSFWLTQHMCQFGSDGQQLPLICQWITGCIINIIANCVQRRNRDQTKKSEISISILIRKLWFYPLNSEGLEPILLPPKYHGSLWLV